MPTVTYITGRFFQGPHIRVGSAKFFRPIWVRGDRRGAGTVLFVGIDVGGTFTDIVVYDADRNESRVLKLPTTPNNPGEAILEGLSGFRKRAKEVALISHASTIATNALLTHTGLARTALVINDGFMSTDHCQITCSPAGFTLIDSGSTNGCYVNDRKVQRHDLVDNDMITLGKTNLKFKSIN